MIRTLKNKIRDEIIKNENNCYKWAGISLGKEKSQAMKTIKGFIEYFMDYSISNLNDSFGVISAAQYDYKFFALINDGINDDFLVDKGKIVASYFLQDSLRTHATYYKACVSLGINYYDTTNQQGSKNCCDNYLRSESEEDVILVFNELFDLIISRHPSIYFPFFYQWLSEKYKLNIPFINAGSGFFEHPVQALSDAILLHKKFNLDRGLRLAFVGDCYNIRSIRSLIYTLSIFDKIKIIFFTKNNRISHDLIYFLNKENIDFYILDSFNSIRDKEVLSTIDCFYFVRYYSDEFNLTEAIIPYISKNATIMHPMPRDQEIPNNINLRLFKKFSILEQLQYSVAVKRVILNYYLNR